MTAKQSVMERYGITEEEWDDILIGGSAAMDHILEVRRRGREYPAYRPTCEYCGCINRKDRCDSCGAPIRQPKRLYCAY